MIFKRKTGTGETLGFSEGSAWGLRPIFLMNESGWARKVINPLEGLKRTLTQQLAMAPE